MRARRFLADLVTISKDDIALLSILTMAIVSILVSPIPSRSVQAILPLLLGLVFYWIITHDRRILGRTREFGMALALVGMFIGFVGFAGMLAKPRTLLPWMRQAFLALHVYLQPFLVRLPDTFHPNVVAGAMVILLPFSITGWTFQSVMIGPRRWRRRLLQFATCVMTFVLLLTQSRGAWLAMTLEIAMMLFFLRPKLVPYLAGGAVLTVLIIGFWRGWTVLPDGLISADPFWLFYTAPACALSCQSWGCGRPRAQPLSTGCAGSWPSRVDFLSGHC